MHLNSRPYRTPLPTVEPIESFSQLFRCDSESAWSNLVFQLGDDHGYGSVFLALFAGRHVPQEAPFVFLHSNYASSWRSKYEQERLWAVDPSVLHCAMKTTPLVWSSETFAGSAQRRLYEESCRHGIRAGISFPMNGTRGEFGVLCFATDAMPDKQFLRNAYGKLPILSCLRDYVLESSLQFMRARAATGSGDVTSRELECLNWSAAGKTSWEIAQILRCSEATVNFHLKNLRRKFNVTSRQQAVVKAMRLGLLSA